MHFPTLALTVLLASPSVLAAHDNKHTSRSSTHARHRRLAHKQPVVPEERSAAPVSLDLQGRQLPGKIAMRKRSSGNCKAKSSSASSVNALQSSANASSDAASPTTTQQSATSYYSSSADVQSPSYESASASSTQVVGALVSGVVGAATSIVGDVESIVSSVLSPATSTSSNQAARNTTSSYRAATTSYQSTVTSSYLPTVTSSIQGSSNQASSSAAVSASSSSSSSSISSYTPNGMKAGIAGGDSYSWMENVLGSWYDWSATPTQKGTPLAIPMLWGGGTVDATDASRLAAFKAITSTPKFILGFEEPDCAAGSGSAGLDVATAATLWNSLVAPWGVKGSILLSPSMCKQADEVWLTPFKAKISRDWDITSIHINKNSMAGVKKDLDYYYNTYGKPISVSEFACVDDSNGFTPCTDQTEINTYINEIVALLEADSRVVSYYYSDGYGLGSVWPTVSNGALSASGQTYLTAISKYH